ncbi:RNA recognition motif 2-domain-containing protein [Lanmaoa asiatica]|nr:RNA recognition motif 2-domain-containing protein [Lanmaoa asiatica]
MSASLRLAAEGNTRPPRLQPSPSLPNLRARNTSSDPQLSRPQPTVHKSSSQAPSLSPAKLSSNFSIKDGDLHPIKRSRQQSKNQHYLTPPLTPASSLRSDSTDPDSTDLNPPNDEQSASPPQNLLSSDSAESRFLIVNMLLYHMRAKLTVVNQIGNVPNDLSEDVIGPYFYSLAALPDDSSSASHKEKRAIILAFYDTRDSGRVKRLIEANGSHSHHGSDVDDKQKTSYESTVGGPWVKALTCLFVNPDHFLQLLGQSASAAMTRTEGAFCVSVGEMMAERDHDYSGWSRVCFFVPVKLKSVLAKYGELKSFFLIQEDEEKCIQLFMVEYYDIRAGELAWESLNGRVVDNMKLRLVQRDVLRGGCSGPRDLEKEDLVGVEGHLGGGHSAEPKTPTASTYLSQSQAITTSSGVPFPLLNDAGTCDYPRPCEQDGANANSLDAGSAINSHKSTILDRQKIISRYPMGSIEATTDEAFSADHPHERAGPFTPDQFGRRGSNNLFFDAVRSRTHHRPADTDYMRTASMNSIAFDHSQVYPFEVAQVAGGATDLCTPPCPGAQPPFVHDYFTHADRYAGDTSVQPPWISSSLAHNMQYPVSSQSHMPMCSSICWDASTGTWVAWGAPGILPEHWSAFPPSPGYYHGSTSQAVPYSYPPHASPPLVHHPCATTPNRVYPTTYPASPRAPPENNQLDIRKIEQGLDTRTTVMIKNIPNKMTDKELIAYINKICPRRIDFLYLRMDFQNGCNVGYAFVNFIGVEDLLRFAKTTLGEKWNMYSSEKVLQMSYANYQGKEALVEKFKNSCIMDEREEWRPKIFFSDPGPKQGLPEEFPKPTHMRRKERSSYNRGALFVPGINGGTGYPKTFLNAMTSHQRTSRPPATSQGDERQRKPNYSTDNSSV